MKSSVISWHSTAFPEESWKINEIVINSNHLETIYYKNGGNLDSILSNEKYSAFIMPRYGSYNLFTDFSDGNNETIALLKQWVSNGGSLILTPWYTVTNDLKLHFNISWSILESDHDLDTSIYQYSVKQKGSSGNIFTLWF